MASAQVTLPYHETFSDISDFENFVVADENADGDTWRYDDFDQAARCERNYDADDWLLTPIFELQPGFRYELSFKAYLYMDGSEILSVYLGNSRRVSSFVTNVMPETSIDNLDPVTYSVSFTVDEVDDYRLGFRLSTEGDPYSNYLYLDDISLTVGASLQTPAPVENFSVTPGPQGALFADIALTAPQLTAGGNPLAALSRIDLYRDNVLVHAFDNLAPGAQLSWQDAEGLSSGLHDYKAVAVNEAGASDPVSAEVFVGIDQPGPVQNLHFAYDYDTHHAVVSWEPPTTGVHGGYIDTANLRYSLRRYLQPTGTILTEPITDTSFEDDVDIEWLEEAAEIRYRELEEQYHYTVARTIVVDGQGLMYYYVKPISDTGEGTETTTEVRTIGDAYTLPFEESFPEGFSSHLWYKPVTPGHTRWYEISDSRYSQDGDNGFLAISATVDDESLDAELLETTRAQSGRLCFTDCDTPVMTFYYYCAYAMEHPLKVNVSTDGILFDTVMEIDLSNEEGTQGWKRVVVPLDAIANQRDCYVAFEATLTNSSELIYLDNIAIYNQYDDDVTPRITRLPAFLRSAETRNVTVAVSNIGLNAVPEHAYTAEVYANDVLIGSVPGPALNVGEITEVVVPVVATASLPANCTVYAQLDYPADNNISNNRSKGATLTVRYPSYPVPQDLTLTQTADGSVAASNPDNLVARLSWAAPQAPRTEDESFTDGFETYPDFTITDLGDWVLVDRDRTLTYSWGENYMWPNRTMPHAFIVMNPSEVELGTGGKGLDPYWNAYDGDKMLMSSSFMADDWLISPELPGTAQTVSFYARTTNSYAETFELCTSATDTETESFVRLGNVITAQSATWVKYDYNLPEGTRFFAIHRTTFDGNMFFVDDVTFVPERLARQDITLLGYNVWCDGIRLNEALVTATSFDDPVAREEAHYTVTAVYDKGESGPSNTASILSGIDELPQYAPDGKYAPDGRSIAPSALYDLYGRPATGKQKGIYIRQGRKVVVK